MKPEYKDIKEVGINLEVDDKINVICFFCKNDWIKQNKPTEWTPKKSLSIKRVPLGYVYHCYRSGCSRGTGIVGGDFRYPLSKKKRNFLYQNFVMSLYNPLEKFYTNNYLNSMI